MKIRTRIMAAGLSALLLCTVALPTIAAAPSTEKEEVVYVMTNASGTVQNMNVVNIFGSGRVTDYGDYTAVKMLTTNDPITQNGDEITFTTAAIGQVDDLKTQLDSFQTFCNGVNAYTGGEEVYSFVSDKNTDVDSVQFVIKTAAVEKAEEPVPEEVPTVKRTFWQKLLHLFGLDK